MALARNESGGPVVVDDPSAASWCLNGGAGKVAGLTGVPIDGYCTEEITGSQSYLRYRAIHQRLVVFHHAYLAWQDIPERQHREVVAFLDRVVESTEAKEKA